MVKSAVYVPLIVGGEATGRISLQNIDREHAFSEADVRLLTTLAGSLSVALENARLFEETRQRNAELALINDIKEGSPRTSRCKRCTTSSASGSIRSSTRRRWTSVWSITRQVRSGSPIRSSVESG
jgi:transcriptional regulator with GAF, ATPase, and Fis domain